jgi:hypothetical protein
VSFPSVTTILSDGGVGFDMSHLPQEYSDRGTLIHKYAECKALECELPEIPEKWRGYADAVDRFWDDNKPQPVLVEPELEHDLMGFMGHPDLLEEGEFWHDLDDYKTGSVPLYAGPQLMLYKLLIQRNFPHIKHIRRRAIELSEKGTYKLVPFNDDARDLAIGMEAYYGYMERRGYKWTHR